MITKTLCIVVRGIELCAEYTYKPLVKGVYDKAPEDCYEDEPAETIICSVDVEGFVITELLSDNVIEEIIDKIEKHELEQ
jgi:hypothetical protein